MAKKIIKEFDELNPETLVTEISSKDVESVSTVPQCKFMKNFTQSFSEIRASRAKLVLDETRTVQEQIVNEKLRAVNKILSQIESLSDLAPESTTSLKNPKFSAEDWCQQMQELKQKLFQARLELKIAQETYNEYFVA